MTVLESLAEEHRKATTAAQTSGFRRNVATWNQVDFNNVVDSWQQQLPRVTRVAEDVQEFSVIDAAAFMTVASAVQGRDIDDQINVDSYVGAMPYTGADLDAAFAGPAYRTLEAVRQNKPPNVAMYAGVAELARLTHAVTFDTAEEASLTVALSQHLTYQRIPQVGCCVRCSMLTGQYFTSKVFKRHPHCRCVHVPVLDPADAPKRSNDPYELFNALSEEEQNKIWTKAGAQAIRDGADIYQVGNSLTRPLPHRRSRRFTSEGAGKHGWYRNNAPAGKAGKRRLTVHEIYRRADGDTHTAKRLMREYGYLLGPQDPNGLNAGLHMTNAGKKWLKQKALNEWKAAHGVWDRSVRQPKAWDAFPDLHKRVADLQATRAVARTLERQRVYKLRVHAYEAIALAEAGRRVVTASRPVPGPSPSLGSRRPVRPHEHKPATATGGAGGRGNGTPPVAPSSSSDNWDEPMKIGGVTMPFAERDFPMHLTDGELHHVLDEHLYSKDPSKSQIPRTWGRDPAYIKTKLEDVLVQAKSAATEAKITSGTVEILVTYEGRVWAVILHRSKRPGLVSMYPK